MESSLLKKLESLAHLDLENLGNVYWDLPAPALYEEAIRRHEGILSHLGPLVVRTGQYTGRLPKDKFFVREPSSESKICWGDFAPRKRWKDPAAYDKKARELAGMFESNFRENAGDAPDEVRDAGPRIASGPGTQKAHSAMALERVAV
jgi:ATP-dependent phosphoenolpyruvate carboxykinase